MMNILWFIHYVQYRSSTIGKNMRGVDLNPDPEQITIQVSPQEIFRQILPRLMEDLINLIQNNLYMNIFNF